LCHDFSESEIHIDTSVDLSNPAIVADAVVNNPSCAGCHQAMDPLASYFFPYVQIPLNQVSVPSYPLQLFASSNAGLWETTNGRPPGYFGTAPEGLAGLGQAIADDPRFARCAVVHFAAYLTEQPVRALSQRWIAALQADFVDNAYNARQLARAIVLSDPFRTAHDEEPLAAETVVGYQKLRPQQLERVVRDLTGFTWQADTSASINGWSFGHVDYLDDDYLGFRVLSGGIDSWYVTEPSHTMNATASLVARRVAQLAAAFVVEQDAATAGPRRLFTQASPDDAEPSHVRAQLAELHARIYSALVADDDPALDDTWTLFDGALAASGSPRRAWTVTLTGMLSDLRALYY
jgi:hypothetical protein